MTIFYLHYFHTQPCNHVVSILEQSNNHELLTIHKSFIIHVFFALRIPLYDLMKFGLL